MITYQLAKSNSRLRQHASILNFEDLPQKSKVSISVILVHYLQPWFFFLQHPSHSNNDISNLVTLHPLSEDANRLRRHCTGLDSYPCSRVALHSPWKLDEINQCYYVIWDLATRSLDNGMLHCSYNQGKFIVLCWAWKCIEAVQLVCSAMHGGNIDINKLRYDIGKTN